MVKKIKDLKDYDSHVGPLEMKTLGVLSADEALSVTEVQSLLKKAGHDLAYTTVMTVLTRLHQKNHIQRNKEGRQFLYSLKTGKEQASHKLFNNVKEALFQKDRLVPILALLGEDGDLNKEELTELKNQINERLKELK